MLKLIAIRNGSLGHQLISRAHYDKDVVEAKAHKANTILASYDHLQYLIDRSVNTDIDEYKRFHYKKLTYLYKEIINEVIIDYSNPSKWLQGNINRFNDYMETNDLRMKNENYCFWE